MLFAILLIFVVALAYGNGANDNFKGVATLLGSGTTDYRWALRWATITTLLGSLTAVFLAGQLLKNFSGRGLVDSGLVTTPHYIGAVAFGASLTVLIATRIGMPISTTHSLIGALVGAGWAAGSEINVEKLGVDFLAPLLGSPFLAIAATIICYPLFYKTKQFFGVTDQSCLCIDQKSVDAIPVPSTINSASALSAPALSAPAITASQQTDALQITVGNITDCQTGYHGRILGIAASTVLDRLHYLSAGAVCFARGLNDTPKIAALLLVMPLLGNVGSTLAVAVPMVIGGLLSARRVAEMMSQKITPMNHGQGFTANLITSLIVIGASRFQLPVSTTHVSCGALFGIGTVTRQARVRTIAAILSAWITTLPAACFLGFIAFQLLGSLR